MLGDLLKKVGLDEKEAEVYETLLSMGKAGVGKILPKTSLKRGSAYNALYGLKEKGLVSELTENGKKVFQIESPQNLEKVVATNEQRLKEASASLTGTLPSLQSSFNLIMHRPNVRFFEGMAGVQKVVDDSLTATETIYSYVDDVALSKFARNLSLEHTQKRQRLQIKKSIIIPESAYARAHAAVYRSRSLTEYRTLATDKNFSTVIQIYDKKVSYITLDEKGVIGVILEDPHIYQTHRLLFELSWKTAKPLARTVVPAAG